MRGMPPIFVHTSFAALHIKFASSSLYRNALGGKLAVIQSFRVK